MFDGNTVRDLIRRRLSRRTLFRAGGAGAASALIVGLGTEAGPVVAAAGQAGVAAVSSDRAITPLDRADLRAVDPHVAAGRAYVAPAAQQGPTLRILPLNRAKFLAGGRFDLRVEAANVDPNGTSIQISIQGPNGPAAILTGEPVRTNARGSSLEVTYRGLS